MRRLPSPRDLHVQIIGLTLLVLVPIRPVALAAGVLLLGVVPGVCIVRAMRLGQQWDRTGRLILGIAVSLAVTPVVLNPLWHFTNKGTILWGIWFALASIAGWWFKPLTTGPLKETHRFFEHRATKWYALLITVVVVVGTIGPYWPTELLGFPVPCTIHDFVKHHAVLDSFSRRPLPLGNVFYADGAAGPVYYYHLFYIIPATLQAWSGVGPELCFGLASALGALALTSMVYMLTKRLKPGEAPATLAAALVTLVGALDVVPLAVEWALGRGRIVVTLDAWADNIYRVHNFLNQMIWSPQNVQGVTVTLLGVLLLGHYGPWRGWLLWGPVLGASLVGSSVWVAMAVMPGLALWGLLEIVKLRRDVGKAAQTAVGLKGIADRGSAGASPSRHQAAKTAAGLAGVAVLMLGCALPSVYGYAEMSARHGKSLTLEWPPHHWSVFGRWVGPGVLANVLDLPMMLTFDQGGKFLFLFGVGAATWRRAWRDDGLRLLWLASVLALAGAVTFRSHFYYNDFGQKIMLVPMAFTAIMAACVLDPVPSGHRWWNPLGWQLDRERFARHRRPLTWLVGLVIIAGLPMGFYEAPVTAFRRHLEARRTPAEERAALGFLRYQLPVDAVVQADWRQERAKLAQTIRRQIGVMADQDDVLIFRPADWETYQAALADVEQALQETDSPAEAHRLLRRHQITHVYVGAVERRRWKHFEKFDDPTRFRSVFQSGLDRVYEVLEP